MNITGVDLTEWRMAARELLRTSHRTAADFVNGQALAVASRAVKMTLRTPPAKIQAQLGVIGHETRLVKHRKGIRAGTSSYKKGKAILRQDSFAARILAERFRKTGKWGVKGNTLEQRAAALIAIRTRSATFIASGWIWAIRILWAFVKRRPSNLQSYSDARAYGRPKGAAIPARQSGGSVVVAQITNSALLAYQGKYPAPGGDPMPPALAGLQAAINASVIDMRETLIRRMQQELEKYNARHS